MVKVTSIISVLNVAQLISLSPNRIYTLVTSIQFRWMGSADMGAGNFFRQDMWALASVNVTVDGSILFSETFGNSTLE